jgi:glucose/arabinose dehydrogenase
MMKNQPISVVVVCAAVALFFVPSFLDGAGVMPQAAAGDETILDVAGGQIRVVTVAAELVHPWSIAFLPDERMLVAESAGRVRLIEDNALTPEAVWSAPEAGSGDRLHGLAVHPRFDENRFVYVSYPKQEGEATTLAVARGRLEDDRLVAVEEIFVADAWETGGNLAGRLKFGPDETLYVSVGDRDRLCCIVEDDPSLRMKAQDLGSHVGKVLRIRDDGTIPLDNPFVGDGEVSGAIFTYGHRNTYGFDFHPETGDLWQAEIGPLGGDELNILFKGHNYGWPLVSMGRNYTGTLVSDEPWIRDGMDNPRMFWVPSVSPSSIAFYTGDQFPDWQGSLLVGTLNGKQLQRVSFNQPSQAERRESLLLELDIRVRDVTVGPDGNVYVATELASGGNDATGTILRIEPVE